MTDNDGKAMARRGAKEVGKAVVGSAVALALTTQGLPAPVVAGLTKGITATASAFFGRATKTFELELAMRILEDLHYARQFASEDAARDAITLKLNDPDAQEAVGRGFWLRMQAIDGTLEPSIAALVADYAVNGWPVDYFFRAAGGLLAALTGADLLALRFLCDQYLAGSLKPGQAGWVSVKGQEGITSSSPLMLALAEMDRVEFGRPGKQQDEENWSTYFPHRALPPVLHTLKQQRFASDFLSGGVGATDPNLTARLTADQADLDAGRAFHGCFIDDDNGVKLVADCAQLIGL